MNKKPRTSKKQNVDKDLEEAISAFTNTNGTTKTIEQISNEIDEFKEKEANKGIWKNLNGGEKFTAKIHISAIIIPAITAIITIFLTIWNANQQIEANQESMQLLRQQDSTNQANLDLMIKEYELNYRPYISVSESFYNRRKDTLLLTFIIKNTGKVPAIINIEAQTNINGDALTANSSFSQLILFPSLSHIYTGTLTGDGCYSENYSLKLIYRTSKGSKLQYITNYECLIDHKKKAIVYKNITAQ